MSTDLFFYLQKVQCLRLSWLLGLVLDQDSYNGPVRSYGPTPDPSWKLGGGVVGQLARKKFL